MKDTKIKQKKKNIYIFSKFPNLIIFVNSFKLNSILRRIIFQGAKNNIQLSSLVISKNKIESREINFKYTYIYIVSIIVGIYGFVQRE